MPKFTPERAYKITSGEPGVKDRDIIEIRTQPDGSEERCIVVLVPKDTPPELKFDITTALRHAYEAGAEDQRAQSEPQGGVVGYVVAVTGGALPWALESAWLSADRDEAETSRDGSVGELAAWPGDPHEYAVCAVVRLEEARGNQQQRELASG